MSSPSWHADTKPIDHTVILAQSQYEGQTVALYIEDGTIYTHYTGMWEAANPQEASRNLNADQRPAIHTRLCDGLLHLINHIALSISLWHRLVRSELYWCAMHRGTIRRRTRVSTKFDWRAAAGNATLYWYGRSNLRATIVRSAIDRHAARLNSVVGRWGHGRCDSADGWGHLWGWWRGRVVHGRG